MYLHVFYSQEECLVSVCGLLVKPMSGTHVFIVGFIHVFEYE